MAESATPPYADARLTARPRLAGSFEPLPPGDHVAGPSAGWAGSLFIPRSYTPSKPAPFMLTLHGATGRGERMLARWRDVANEAGVVVLAPDSLERTWDVLADRSYGRDVARIDVALHDIFDRLRIDRAHVLVEGFSDGASYALSLGIANGDLFTHVLGNSPGFCWPPSVNGSARILLTHGNDDQILPINVTSRLLAPQLDRAGYDVTYHEFEGGHQLTEEIMRLSLRWAGVLS